MAESMEIETSLHERQLVKDGAKNQIFPAELSLFEAPPLSAAYIGEQFIDYRASTPDLNSGGSIDFVVPAMVSQFVSLARSRLHLRFRIVQKDGSRIDPDIGELCAPINYIGATLFETVHLYINQVLVSAGGSQHIPYRAYIEALLDRTRNEKDCHLENGLFARDTSGFFDKCDDSNAGFIKRYGYTINSNPTDTISPLITDMAQQDRLLLSGLELLFRFWPASPAFTLMTQEVGAAHKIEILDAYIRVCRLLPQPAITLAIHSTLQKTPALYPHARSSTRKFLLATGSYDFSIENVYTTSQVPAILVLGLVRSKACSGQYKLNPFKFEHMHLSSLNVEVDGKPARKPGMKLHFEESIVKSSFLDGFESLYEGWPDSIGRSDPSDFLGITRLQWAQDYTLYSFKLTQGGSKHFLPVIPMGNLRIYGTFSEPLPENTTLICYSRFPSLLSVDRSRRVQL